MMFSSLEGWVVAYSEADLDVGRFPSWFFTSVMSLLHIYSIIYSAQMYAVKVQVVSITEDY